MNTLVKKIACIIGITLLFSFIIFKAYHAEEKEYTNIYLLQVGAYKSYDNVIKNTRVFDNYMIYEDENLYKLIIAISLSDEVYDKLTSIYAPNKETFKSVLKTNDEELIKKLSSYDNVILSTDNKNNINIVIKEELKLLSNLLNKKEKI